jgi:hypothetical protein
MLGCGPGDARCRHGGEPEIFRDLARSASSPRLPMDRTFARFRARSHEALRARPPSAPTAPHPVGTRGAYGFIRDLFDRTAPRSSKWRSAGSSRCRAGPRVRTRNGRRIPRGARRQPGPGRARVRLRFAEVAGAGCRCVGRGPSSGTSRRGCEHGIMPRSDRSAPRSPERRPLGRWIQRKPAERVAAVPARPWGRRPCSGCPRDRELAPIDVDNPVRVGSTIRPIIRMGPEPRGEHTGPVRSISPAPRWGVAQGPTLDRDAESEPSERMPRGERISGPASSRAVRDRSRGPPARGPVVGHESFFFRRCAR